MQNQDEVMLQCPNDLCKAANPETDKYCERCGMTMIKRYLWSIGDSVETCQIGELVAERYLLKSDRIFLDTKPGLLPETPDLDTSSAIKPYLRLVKYRLQIPQVYGSASLNNKEILLLEQAPIYTDAVPQSGQLMPQLCRAWKEASSLRQINWLLQIAQLWQPLQSEGVASSLLVPQLLRVDRSLVRLLQLQLDEDKEPTLSQLGQLWSQLATGARPSIAGFLHQLSKALQQGEFQSAEQLIACLDLALAEVGRSSARKIEISTCTDTGPSRQRNEDACYPASGTTITKPPARQAIAIVCDGIGGHEGGNVASNLAIETLQQQVEQLPLDEIDLDPVTLSVALEQFACTANDRISQRNDKENRHGRQRMGTTLVMAVGHRHEMYVGHVGDSRAYWITRTGCYQITLDDDVAAREVRLGYAIYRDALQQPSAGSLVQAIGMSASVHPTIGRFVLDEDCVFLLCSDGLSDFDLVEQCWQTDILAILDGEVDLAHASRQLVEIGNTRNGHDNITVALVRCQIDAREPETPLNYSLPVETMIPGAETALPQAVSESDSLPDTRLLSSKPNRNNLLLKILLGIALIVSLGGLLAYLAIKGKMPEQLGFNFGSILKRSPDKVSSATDSPLQQKSIFVVKGKIILNRTAKQSETAISSETATHPSPSTQPFSPIKGILPAGSVVELLGQKPFLGQGMWVNLKVVDVCSSLDSGVTSETIPKAAANQSAPKTQTGQPSATGGNPNRDLTNTKSRVIGEQPAADKSRATGTTTGERLLQQGEDGWVQAANIEQQLLTITAVTAEQFDRCSAQTPEQNAGAQK